MSEKLKPCPFCGGQVKLVVDFPQTKDPVYCFECEDCGALVYMDDLIDKDKSIEAWNKRSNPWHTGTPTETGEYLVCRVPEAGYLFRYNQLCVFSDLMGTLDHKIFYIGEVGKNSFENITDSVIAWQKIEPFKEEKDDEYT